MVAVASYLQIWAYIEDAICSSFLMYFYGPCDEGNEQMILTYSFIFLLQGNYMSLLFERLWSPVPRWTSLFRIFALKSPSAIFPTIDFGFTEPSLPSVRTYIPYMLINLTFSLVAHQFLDWLEVCFVPAKFFWTTKVMPHLRVSNFFPLLNSSHVFLKKLGS